MNIQELAKVMGVSVEQLKAMLDREGPLEVSLSESRSLKKGKEELCIKVV
jgi:hypothetical protein